MDLSARAALSRVLVLAAWLLAPGAGAAPAVPPHGDGPSAALGRLAAFVEGQPEGVRADFASVALGEMLIAYEHEFEGLSLPGQVSRRELAKQARWASALRGFLDELYAARDALDAGAPVEVVVAPPAPVQILVGERLVPLASPRIEDPGALDGAIVRAYCDLFPCDPGLLEPQQVPSPAARDEHGGWSFGAGRGSIFETADGLGFMFPDVRARSVKEQACRRVRDELLHLAAALDTARRAGTVVDFGALRIEPAAHGDDARVVLSESGAVLRMRLPALARAPGVVEVARAWLRARADGRAYTQLFPRADLLLAGLIGG